MVLPPSTMSELRVWGLNSEMHHMSLKVRCQANTVDSRVVPTVSPRMCAEPVSTVVPPTNMGARPVPRRPKAAYVLSGVMMANIGLAHTLGDTAGTTL